MNRKQAMHTLKDIFDYFWIEIEDRGIDGELTEIMEVLEKPITLADLLGWEEDVEYEYCKTTSKVRYKIQNGDLFYYCIHIDAWAPVYDQWCNNLITNLQKAKKVEPKLKAYHVKDEYSYYCLMKEFEEQGYTWISNTEPTHVFHWDINENDTVIYCHENKKLTYSSLEGFNASRKDKYDLIEYRKEEPLYYAELKVPAGIETHSWLKQLNYDNTVFDMVSWFQLDKRDAKTKTEWSKLDINNTNVNFREVKE